MLVYVFAVILAILGSVAYRLRGMSSESQPISSQTVRRLMFASVLGLGAIIAGGSFGPYGLHVHPALDDLAVFGATILLSFLGIVIGHGSYMQIMPPYSPNPDNEIFAPILNIMFKEDHSIRRNFAGMSLTGLLVTLPLLAIPGVAWWYGAVGVLKAVGYLLGQLLEEAYPQVKHTEFAEYFWGFCAAGLLVLA